MTLTKMKYLVSLCVCELTDMLLFLFVCVCVCVCELTDMLLSCSNPQLLWATSMNHLNQRCDGGHPSSCFRSGTIHRSCMSHFAY